MKKDWFNKPRLLVINHERYWLTCQQMKVVKQIQKTYPHTWEAVVLQRMNTLSL